MITTVTSHAATWNAVQGLLQQASEYLSAAGKYVRRRHAQDGCLGGTLDEFLDFVEHNELELAWDALAELGRNSEAPSDFWGKLAEAAALMELPSKILEAEKRTAKERIKLEETKPVPVNKTAAVRQYMKARPQTKRYQIDLSKKGIKVTANDVSGIKTKEQKRRHLVKTVVERRGVGAAEIKAALNCLRACGSVSAAKEALAAAEEIKRVVAAGE